MLRTDVCHTNDYVNMGGAWAGIARQNNKWNFLWCNFYAKICLHQIIILHQKHLTPKFLYTKNYIDLNYVLGKNEYDGSQSLASEPKSFAPVNMNNIYFVKWDIKMIFIMSFVCWLATVTEKSLTYAGKFCILKWVKDLLFENRLLLCFDE